MGLALAACSSPSGGEDAGLDAGLTGPACDSPEDCRVEGYAGACRQGVCRARVPCTDDVECGLGEACVAGDCRFTGCAGDSDCAVGRCRTDVYACTECAASADCPEGKPVCTAEGKCVACKVDGDCRAPGPSYCEGSSGACVYCKKDEHCANGLSCGTDGTCHGARLGAPCGEGASCDTGLMCVTVNGADQCRRGCSLYTPECSAGEICLKLTFSNSSSLVFDRGVPLGICFQPLQGLRSYRDVCSANCQPNLDCVPDSATASYCRAYCNPNKPVCDTGELCHRFPGDLSGHEYGLCFRDSGFGKACASESACRAGLSCAPAVDPSTPDNLSLACRFSALAADGGVARAPLAPCTQNNDCRSRECRSDVSLPSPGRYFCYGACESDTDCAVGGRTGTCDGAFGFTSGTQSVAFTGCRPRCASPAACLEYGAGYTCGLRLQVPASGEVTQISQLCTTAVGSKRVGEACTQSAECREGHCATVDGRGSLRQGRCTHPCTGDGDCTAPLTDGGTAGHGFSCAQAALIAEPGLDGLSGTADDVMGSAYLCGGKSCSQDADCPASLPICAPETSPGQPLGPLVLRCRAASFSGAVAAGQPCLADAECESGACALLTSPATGRVCFAPCVPGVTACPGALSCVAQAVSLRDRQGNTQPFAACVP